MGAYNSTVTHATPAFYQDAQPRPNPTPPSGDCPDDNASASHDGDGGQGGISVVVGGTDGDGLVNVHADLPDITLPDTGIEVSALGPDSILDAHVPDLLDVTVGGDPSGGGGGQDGGSILPLTVDALHGGDVLAVHAGDFADVTVGGAELGNILGGCGCDGGSGGIDVSVDVGGVGDLLSSSAGDLANDIGHLVDTGSC